jgi:hypothetical protein
MVILRFNDHLARVLAEITAFLAIAEANQGVFPQREGREYRGWEKDYHEVTANRTVSAGGSDKTQHFHPPFCTF